MLDPLRSCGCGVNLRDRQEADQHRWCSLRRPAYHVTLLLVLTLLLLQVPHIRSEYLNQSTEMPPVFLDTATNVTVSQGAMAILPCTVRHLGTRQVAWRRVGAKDSHFLTVGESTWVRNKKVMVEHHKEPGYISHWDLLLMDVAKEDGGVYECQITDKEKYVRHVTLEVSDAESVSTSPPQPAITVKGKQYVEMGNPIHLVCKATGGAQIPEDVDWFKDGIRIDSTRDSKMVITKLRSLEQQAFISELIIDHSRLHDSGNYICRSSEIAIDSLKVTVLVASKGNVKRQEPDETTSELGGSSADRRPSRVLWLVLMCCVVCVLTT